MKTNFVPVRRRLCFLFTGLAIWGSGAWAQLSLSEGSFPVVYSRGSGSWTAPNLWNTQPDGSGTDVTDPSSTSTSAVIQSGHNITLPGPKQLENLTIESGASLATNQGSNRYLQIYGSSVIINGSLGGPNDGLSLDINGPNCTLSGSGSIRLSRIRKDNDPGAGPTTNLTIENCTVNLSWSSSGALYNNGSAGAGAQRTFNVTIAPSATVNVAGNVVIDGASGTGVAWNDGAFTINGTLNIGGDLLVMTGNPSGGDVNYIINGAVTVGGVVRGAQEVSSGAAVANLIVNSGGVLRLTGSGDVFSGISGIRETFTFHPGSTVEFAGGTAQNIHPFTFSNLSATGGGAKTLTGSTTVNGMLSLLAGNIILGPHHLTLQTIFGPAWGSTASSYVIAEGAGAVVKASPDESFIFPVGTSSAYMPCRISGAGAYIVNLSDVAAGLDDASSTLNKQWNITRTSGSGNIKAEFQWPGTAEGFHFNIAAQKYLYRNAGASWERLPVSMFKAGSDPFVITFSGVPCCSAFVPGAEAALPIELLFFEGRLSGDAVLLIWRTAAEKDNDYMAVERMTAAGQWRELGRVPGAGTTTVPQDYRFTDEKPLPGINYYRLRQVDYDGTATYHNVIALEFRQTAPFTPYLFPNPARERLSLNLGAPATREREALLLDTRGRVLQRAVAAQGSPQAEFQVACLPAGVYFVRVEGVAEAIRFVKE